MAEEKPGEAKSEPTSEEKMDAWGKRMDAMCDRMDAFMSKHDKRKDDDDDDDRKDAKRDDDEFPPKKDAKKDEGEGEGEEGAMDDKRKDAKRKDKDFDKWAKEEGEEPEHKDDKRKDAKKDEGEEGEAEEGEKGKPEPTAADDKRKDAKKDDDDDDDRKDARADNAVLRRRLAALERQVNRPRVSDDDLNGIAEDQHEWDKVAMAHGERASRPMDGEPRDVYNRRHAKRFQKYSPKWGKVNLAELPATVQAFAFPEIRTDSIKAAHHPDPGAAPRLREITTTDRTGRIISEFVGPVSATLAPFRMPVMRVKRINNNPGQFV